MTRDVRLLFISRALRMFSNGGVALILVLYLAALGLDGGRIGLLLSLTLLGDTVVSLILSTSADRWGRRRVLMVGGILMAAAGLVFVLTTDFVLLVIAATIGVISPSGSDVGPFLPVEQASLSHVLPDRARTAGFGWYQVAGSISVGLGGVVAGLLVTYLKSSGVGELDAYRVVIAGSALVGLVMAAMPFLISSAVEVEPSAQRAGGRLGIHKSRGVVARLSVLFAVDSFASGVIPMALVLFWLNRRFGVDEAGLGGIYLGFNFLSGLSAPLSVWVARRIGLVNTMVFTHLPADLLLLAIPFMPTAPAAVAVVLVRAAITQMDIPVRQSYVMAVVEPDERSASAGITNMVRSLSQSAGPGISTPLLVVPGLSFIPFFIGGILKVGYDVGLWKLFSSRPAPEEERRGVRKQASA